MSRVPSLSSPFLLGFDGADLRGEPMAIGFWARLGDEERYASVDELVHAIGLDVERTRTAPA